MKPYKHEDLKDLNRRTVFQLISNHDGLSKAEISRITGISAPTVIKIIQYFIEQNLVEEIGTGDSLLGRKPQLLKFNPNASYSIGLEFDGEKIQIGLINLLGELSNLKTISYHHHFLHLLKSDIVHIVNTYLDECKTPNKKILGLGIAIPGVVDSNQMLINIAPLVEIYEPISIKADIETLKIKLGFPIIIENDVNAGAKGEFVTRKLQTHDDLLYISLCKGIGAGIILEGKLRKGTRHLAGEIGYTVLEYDFKTEKSKPGWLESRDYYQRVFNHIKYNKPYMHEDMKKIASDMGLLISNMIALLDFEKVVIGGCFVEYFGQLIIDLIGQNVEKYCLENITFENSVCEAPAIIGMGKIVIEEELVFEEQ